MSPRLVYGPDGTATLTPRPSDILRFIESYAEENGYPPTIREIGRKFGIASTNGVYDHLQALERKGFLLRRGNAARAIETTRQRDGRPRKIVVLGRVTAGQLVEQQEDIEGHIQVDPTLVGAGQAFALHVRGESMVEAGIYSDDLVIVRQQSHVANGDIAVVDVSGETTLKRFYDQGANIRLQPENSSMPPIIKPRADVKVIGKVIGLYRKY